MPLPDQPVTINVAGLSQKVDPKARVHGTLEVADNVEFEKAGTLNKRRGYRYLNVLAGDIHDNPSPTLFSAVAQFRDELVLLSDDLWSVVSPIREVDATSIVRRGPLPRGGYRIRAVVGDGVGEDDLAPP
jgi:hypothetical protein